MKKKTKNKTGKFFSYIEKNWQKAAIWLFGALVGLFLTKACNTIWPDAPVIVKEHTDTVKVIHSIDPLQDGSDSILKKQIEQQLMNIELLNRYEENIAKRREAIGIGACKIIIDNPYPNSRGYSTQSASSICIIDLKENGPFIDIAYSFLREDYVDMINTLNVKIYRKNVKDNRSIIVSDLNYEPEKGKTELLVRIVNDLSPDEYTIEAGFILKENRLDKYPAFYRQTFQIRK